jgi:hypothetical protein
VRFLLVLTVSKPIKNHIKKRRNPMNHKSLITFILVVILSATVVFPAQASTGIQYDLAQVRRATAAFHDISIAQAAGYQLLPFYSFCVYNPELGAMGVHYINMSIIDTVVDPLQPEAMAYVPDETGVLQLASVEYIVAASAWDAENPEPPTIFGQTFGYNPAFGGLYTLHAWIWIPNPAGMFSYYNPQLSCN